MQVSLSRVSPVEVSLRVALPRERVSAALSRAYAEVGKEATLRGFRKGKAPLSLVKQFFGGRVAELVTRKLIEETLPGAMTDQNVTPLAQPRVEAFDDIEGSADWSYTTVIEVRPDINDIKLDTLQVTRTVYEVSEADVDKAIEAKRRENVIVRTPESPRPSRDGDVITVDIEFLLDGEVRTEFSSRGRTITVGSSKLLPEIDAALAGHSEGETFEVNVTFPATHRQKDLANRAAVARVTVNEVKESVLPELDDAFAKDVGYDSVADLRANVRKNAEEAAAERSEGELRGAILDALVASNPVPVPPSMLEAAISQMRSNFVRSANLRSEVLSSEFDALLMPEAEKQIRGSLVFAEIARREGIVVGDADFNERIEALAKETGKAVQRLRVEYGTKQKREQLLMQALEDKVFEVLKKHATITDKPAERATEGTKA